MLKKYTNNPAHLFIDNTPYFITATIYQKRNLLQSNIIKDFLLATIQNSFNAKGWQLKAWVILDNHYHLMVVSAKGEDLSKIMGKIHNLSAQFITNQLKAEKPIWWNYWDYCPRTEHDYYVRLNYLYNNPIKHGLAFNLADYPYSSFHDALKEQGRNFLRKQFKNYAAYKDLKLHEDE